MEILLQVRGEHAVDCIVDDEAARHPQARHQRVAKKAWPEDVEQGSTKFFLLFALKPAVLHPHFRFLDVDADPDDGQRR